MGKVVLSKPRTWVRYESRLCKGCTAGCCTMPVSVTSEELFHMGFLKYQEVEGPLKRVAVRLAKEGIIQAYQDRTRTFVLKQHPNNDCIFLDGNRLCTIYDRRPSVCREFPMNSRRPGFCPHEKQVKPATKPSARKISRKKL